MFLKKKKSLMSSDTKTNITRMLASIYTTKNVAETFCKNIPQRRQLFGNQK